VIAFVTLILSTDNLDSGQRANLNNIIRGLGFDTHVESDQGNQLELPEMVFCGKFEGATTGKIRDDVVQLVSEALKANNIKSRVMVLVSNGYAWALRNV
jgi:hypothetical protein